MLKRKNLFCGDVDARTANGASPLIAKCDRYGYSEDQAPVASHALWSPDTVTWSSYELEGEAYDEPGISPDGSNAIWPEHDGYVTRTAGGLRARTASTRAGRSTPAPPRSPTTSRSPYLYGAQTGRAVRARRADPHR